MKTIYSIMRLMVDISIKIKLNFNLDFFFFFFKEESFNLDCNSWEYSN